MAGSRQRFDDQEETPATLETRPLSTASPDQPSIFFLSLVSFFLSTNKHPVSLSLPHFFFPFPGAVLLPSNPTTSTHASPTPFSLFNFPTNHAL